MGTCEDMCPHAEIVKRCNIEDVPVFERPDPRVATTNTALAVKKFSRNVSMWPLMLCICPNARRSCCMHPRRRMCSFTSVGVDPSGSKSTLRRNLPCAALPLVMVVSYAQVEQTPENFRTIGALRRTMMYLRSIMDRQDMPLVNIHKYLWDRFRGVRQDLFVQGIEVRGPLYLASLCGPAACMIALDAYPAVLLAVCLSVLPQGFSLACRCRTSLCAPCREILQCVLLTWNKSAGA